MKLRRHNSTGCRNERGYIVIALLVILSILLVYITVNHRHLNDLKRELKLFEAEQIKRLETRARAATATTGATNLLVGHGGFWPRAAILFTIISVELMLLAASNEYDTDLEIVGIYLP